MTNFRENFRLRRYFRSKLSPAALFLVRIFACGAILHENLCLECNSAQKFSPVAQYVLQIFIFTLVPPVEFEGAPRKKNPPESPPWGGSVCYFCSEGLLYFPAPPPPREIFFCVRP